MTLLDQGSARWKHLYLNTTQNLKEENIHVSGGIQTRNPSKRETAEIRLSLSLFDNNWIQPFSRSGHSRQNNVLQDILTRHIQTLDSGAAQFHVLSLCYTGVCIKNKWAHINTQKYLINNLWLN